MLGLCVKKHSSVHYRMSSEQDPLLPRGVVTPARSSTTLSYLTVQDQPAPEITGYGFSRQPNEGNGHPEQEEDQAFAVNKASPLNTILGLFTFVVGLALVIALFVPGGLKSTGGDTKNETIGIELRVDKILSENPLIGEFVAHFRGELANNECYTYRRSQRSGNRT